MLNQTTQYSLTTIGLQAGTPCDYYFAFENRTDRTLPFPSIIATSFCPVCVVPKSRIFWPLTVRRLNPLPNVLLRSSIDQLTSNSTLVSRRSGLLNSMATPL